MYTAINGAANGRPTNAPHDAQSPPLAVPPSAAPDNGRENAQPAHAGAAAAWTQAHADAAQSFRLSQPLLILGVGGSGCRIATLAKAILIERFGGRPENAAIHGFDSADERVSYRENRRGSMVSLDQGSEFILLRRVPLGGIKRNIKQHPELVERIGAGALLRIPRLSIHDGAAQERPQGLLSYAWNIKQIDQVLEGSLRRLVERNEDLRHGYAHQSGVNCVIVASTGGGQGSGAVLDLAYLLRERLHTLGDLAESSRIAAMLLLPGALPGVRGPNLLPNTCAFFRELDVLMSGQGFQARYSGGLHLASREAPFDQVFIFDGVDEHGQAWANQDEVCDLAARTLTILFGSTVGMREIADALNERGVLAGRSAGGFGAYLATAGQTALRFPRQQVADRCAIRQAQLVIDDLLAHNDGDDLPASDALVDLATVRDRLRTNRDGAPFYTPLSLPAALEQARPEDAPALARNLCHHFLQRRIYEDVFTQLSSAGRATAAALQGQLALTLDGLLAAGKLTAALRWLEAVENAAERQHAAIAAAVGQAAAAAEQAQNAQDGSLRGLEQAADSFVLFRRREVQKALSLCIDEANRMFEARVALRRQELTRDAGRQLWLYAQEQRLLVQEALARLEGARTALDLAAAELARRNHSRRELTLATPELLSKLFEQYAGSRSAELPAVLQIAGGPRQWAGLAAEELGARLAEVCGQSFGALRSLSVEDLLAQHWDNRSAQQWVAQLRSLSAGAWNLDRALLPGGGADLAGFLTLGVPDESRSIFANSGHTLVSTNDPERIIALSTIYGVAFDMLRPASRWQDEYKKAEGRTSVHILPQFLQSEADGWQAFALGIVFGCIQSAATWFYYRPEDALAAPTRLGQGVEKAIAALAGQPELQAAIMERIESRVAADGAVRALEAIDAYVNADSAGSASGDETARSLRRAAREYAEELRRSQGAVRR